MRDLPNEPPVFIQECSPKYPINKKMISFSDGDANIFSLPPGMESNLIRDDLEGNRVGRVVNPIPYVQNQVGSVIPKETNLNRQTREFLQKSSERRWNPLNMRNIRAGFKMLLDRKSSASHGHIPEEQQPLKSSGISSPVSPNGQTNPVNAFWKEDNFGVICADDLSTADGNAVMKSYDHHLLNGHAISVNPGFQPVNPGSMPVFPSHIERSKRPTTLLVNSMDDDEEDVDTENDIIIDMSDDGEAPKDSALEERLPSIRRKGSGGRRKVVRRVKTPFEIKGRFSLYDDRIMSSQELPSACVVNVSQKQLDTAKFSASVPLNMNTLCVSPASDSSQVDSSQVDSCGNGSSTCVLKDDPKLRVKDKRLNGHILPVIANGQQNLFSLCDI